MYDKGKIIPGLVLLMGLATFPVWYLLASGQGDYVPELQVDAGEKQCVEPPQYMREKHMELLEDWRDSAVRQGERIFLSSSGREYEISLSGTCLGCHQNKAAFCDQCHTYVGAKPNCWDCHNLPSGK